MGLALQRERVAVHSGGRRGAGAGGVDQDGGDGAAEHGTAVDGPQKDQGGGGIHGIGDGNQNSNAHGGCKAGQGPHRNANYRPQQSEQKIDWRECSQNIP